MSTPNPRPRHSARRLARMVANTTEDSYSRREREAIEKFREVARYSYRDAQGARHCYSTLEEAEKQRAENGTNEAIWDAVTGKHIK